MCVCVLGDLRAALQGLACPITGREMRSPQENSGKGWEAMLT